MNSKHSLKRIAGISVIIIILLMTNVASVLASPGNDNFADAMVIQEIPFQNSMDTTDATTETGEPMACGWSFQKTIWYSFSPATSGFYTAESTGVNYPVVAVYNGTDLATLQTVDCQTEYGEARSTVMLEAGTTYYFQTLATNEDWGLSINFSLYPTPLPYVEFSFSPNPPSINEDIEFYNFSHDPVDAGFQSITWDFGDGTITSDWNPIHKFVTEGDYYVALTITTNDGRSASHSEIIQVVNLAPANDNFVNATIIPGLPYGDSIDAMRATAEPGEPIGYNWYYRRTIWYSFTPATSGSYTLEASGGYYTMLSIYTGTSLPDLQAVASAADWTARLVLRLEGGTPYYIQTYNYYNGGLITLNVTQNQSPVNDDFLNAMMITQIPYSDQVDTTYATIEPGEVPACGGNFQRTLWYSFTPANSGSYTVETEGMLPVLAIYTGTSLSDLTTIDCRESWGWGISAKTTLILNAETTYYFQTYATWDDPNINFLLYPTPPPEAHFSYWPEDPLKNESIQFSNDSFDPYGSSIQSCVWDFGDGSSSIDWYPAHVFSADGDYTVQLSVTTLDGRTGLITQIISVRTHDVGITKFTVPTSARAGQTKQISISVKNLYYAEMVQVDLYKVTQNGLELVGSVTQDVPIRPPNRAQVFTFNYTFTNDDAVIGKATFKTIVTIINARDVFPSDNEATSIATRVTR